MLSVAFPDAGFWPAALLAIALLWWVLRGRGAKASFLLGSLFGLAFFLVHIWWAYVSVGVAPWIGLSLVEAMSIGFACAAWVYVRKMDPGERFTWLSPVVFAFCWVGTEQVRSFFPFGGFPWGRVAFSQADGPLGRLAWLGGAPLVSFAVVALGAVVGAAVGRLVERRAVSGLAGLLGVAVLAIAPIVVPLDVRAQTGVLRVGVVQGNVANPGLDAFNNAREVLNNHAEGTARLVASGAALDVVVWPENAADYDPRADEMAYALVDTAAATAGVPLILGTVDYSPPQGRYNTSLVWVAGVGPVDTYSKQRPAAFAEYIPMRPVARLFSSAVDRVTRDMIAGTEPAVVTVPVAALDRDLVVGAVICFEVAYDDIIYQSVSEGAEILVVQTNNASFGVTAESTQQLAMSRLRAIETGRAVVHSSTVGVSALIAPDGRVLQRLELFTAGEMAGSLPLRTSLTPAMKWGAVSPWFWMLAPLTMLIFAVRCQVKDRWEW